ncbi:hypothetical protein BWI96_15845 [Siphonobacter sp. SORGH_AS_0500]|uniref:ABC transporter permease n=1 Tax=Siphonobacter sp. SORGH_AS_0500 TaxID=1864824 RepID=UPI000CC6FAC1|nr:ABC transporter permease [Siphonobacter sp. SORGH_AS_0500]PKK35579.1 hypothetical protein BWI96_15845 [Siphonobacter sp. SORGH_AS_0500]
MLKSYFTIAFRNLWKNRTSSFIDIFGLMIGLSGCLLIGLYIQNEVSFDRFQPKGDRIARVIMEYSFGSNDKAQKGNFTSTKVAPVFQRTFPEVESAVRLSGSTATLRLNNTLVSEQKFVYSDSSFFKVFQADFIHGSSAHALDGPFKVVLTESASKKYFGSANPVGKLLLTAADTISYQVTGVIKDYPANSQMKFDFLASFSSLGANQETSYFNANYTTYLLLRKPEDLASLQAKISPFMKKEMAGSGATIDYYLERFSEIHLHSPYGGLVANTPVTYLYILAAIAGLILMIVCFTYINLSTARSVERAKEVGIRKVIGADNSQLFWQFIGESFIVCVVAVLLSLDVVVLLLPYFNEVAATSLHYSALFTAPFIAFTLGITIAISLLAGTYPALIISGFQPIKVLKGAFKHTSSGKRVQQSLIVFQFTISIFLIAATLIIQNQLHYIQNKNLGFDRHQLVQLFLNREAQHKILTIKDELKKNPDILYASRSANNPANIVSGYSMRSADMPESNQISVNANPIDEDYLKTIGVQLIAGQDLTQQDITNTDLPDANQSVYQFILNESAARQLGWTPKEAIGKRMFLDASRPGYVKAVIKDFHFASLHEKIKPLVLFPEKQGHRLFIKLSGHNVPQTLAFLEATWKKLVPSQPFEYTFLDDTYKLLYDSEIRLGRLMNIFTTLSIILACLGLFGLTSYVVQQRIKEIGIRKVLGASVGNIFLLLSKGFVQLVLVAALIAFPLAWFAMSKWLEEYAYRVSLSWWVFALAGLSTLVVTLLTVSYQAVKAALMNPIRSLKSE